MAQAKRLIDVESPLGPDALQIESVTGTETLGRMFEYEIFALSDKADIDFDALLGQHITLLLETNDDSQRAIDGRVAQIGLVGMRENRYRYRIISRPWTWMMTRTADCRIFQEKSVPDIIKDVFADQAEATFKMNLSGNYKPREYCVQYRETDFNFVSRLMEEEGIYTFFEHEKGTHTLIVCDAPSAHESVGNIPYRPNVQQARSGAEYIREWTVTREIQPGKTALRDYNFETPSTDLTAKSEKPRGHGEADHEIFDYPGEYPDRGEGDQRARTRLEEMQAAYEVIGGSGNARLIRSGGLFTLEEFVRQDQNREYLVVSTLIDARNNLVESGADGGGASFRCTFRLIPGDVHYRPPRSTPRPIVQGPQTAVVVGPSGEEIHVDKYGRIKVQFYWDRLGKKDDKSSCWVRVSQIWAGKNYGWMTIPRIGQEVIVDFLEGDADHPIVTGRVYNAEQMPPWALPANKTQSGILTRSSKEGAPANANEFRFEDKKGSEQVYLHAEKNNDIEVEADETHWVGHDRKKTIDNDENVEVKNNRTEKVGVNETITIGSNRKEEVGANEDIVVKGNRTESVTGNEDLTVTGNQKETVNGTRTLTVNSSETINIGAASSETIKGSLSQTVLGGISITTPGKMDVTATGGVTFTAPGGFTVIAPGGTKTIDNFFTRLGVKTEEIFTNSTAINTMANSISISNNAYAGFKIDTATAVLEGIAMKTANNPLTIGQGATEIKGWGVSILKGLKIIG